MHLRRCRPRGCRRPASESHRRRHHHEKGMPPATTVPANAAVAVGKLRRRSRTATFRADETALAGKARAEKMTPRPPPAMTNGALSGPTGPTTKVPPPRRFHCPRHRQRLALPCGQAEVATDLRALTAYSYKTVKSGCSALRAQSEDLIRVGGRYGKIDEATGIREVEHRSAGTRSHRCKPQKCYPPSSSRCIVSPSDVLSLGWPKTRLPRSYCTPIQGVSLSIRVRPLLTISR